MQVPRAQLRSVGTTFLRRRPWIVAPAMAVAVGALALSPAPRAQVAVLGGAMSSVLAWFSWEALRAGREELDESYLSRSLLGTLVAVAFGCFATGAIRSPLLPFLFAPTVIAFSAFGRARPATTLFVTFLIVVAALTVTPVGFPFPPITAAYALPMAAAAMLGAIVLLRVGVTGLTDAYVHAARDLEVAREAVLSGAEGRARALEGLGAKVAHEIKNPLASVRGLVELVAEGSEGRPGRDHQRLEVALGEIARIEAILREYLSFSRPLEELRPTPVDLLELAREVAAIVDGRAERAGVAVRVTGERRVIEVDPARLKEALLNLASNALEATPRGGEIVLEVSREVRVRDSGRGMSREELARLGAPGYTTREGGTGLGVVLARAAIAQHGGSLEFESEVGRGTVAIVRLGG